MLFFLQRVLRSLRRVGGLLFDKEEGKGRSAEERTEK
jgi:hypothetical protein